MILFMPKYLIPRLVLPLIGYFLFFLQLFYHVLFVTEKNQKVPAHGNFSQPLFGSRVVNDIFQSKRVLKHTPLGT